jgi:formylmethanofuran dehydrogenase subunit B
MAAYVKGEAADSEAALGRAAELLGKARLPVIGGFATDMAGARAGFALAQKLGGVVDHAASDGLMRQNMLMRQTGALTTTFGETRNRADAVVIVGRTPLSRRPGLIDSLCGADETLPRPGKGKRHLILVGDDAQSAPQHFTTTKVPIPEQDGLPGVLAMLAAETAQRCWLQRDDAAHAQIVKAADLLRGSQSTVFVYAPDELEEPVLHTLIELGRHLSQTHRASMLPVQAVGNGNGVNLLSVWTCGLPLRTSFGQIVAEHDPWIYDTDRLAESGEADLLLWIDSLGVDRKPPEGIPTIVLRAPGQPAPQAEIYFEVERPGDSGDTALWCFEIAGIGVEKGRGQKPAHPSVASVLERISELIAEREDA